MAIWHPGSGITYSQFLQTNSFVRDITGQVKTSGKAIQTKVSEQTKQIVASNQELARTFGDGFNSINSTLEWGFNRIEYALEDVNASIDSLHADFNYSMGLLLEEVHTHNKLLSSLLDKLDAIHKTLESPTLTQAREFYHIGCERLSKGLLDKALEALTQAEQKNDTDFFTQFHIGKLYLYGIDDDDNVLDLEKAERHLLLAARYAKAEIPVDRSFAKLAAEALLQASIAIYAQLGEIHLLGDPSKTRALLEEARRLTSEATKLYPQLSEASYHSAKYSALLADPQSSIPNLETAIVGDRNYAVKVDIDHAFDPVRPQVLSLLSQLKSDKEKESASRLDEAVRFHQDCSSWDPGESPKIKLMYLKHNQDLVHAQELHNNHTYFGYLDSISITERLILNLPHIQSERINEIRDQVLSMVSSGRSLLPEHQNYSNETNGAIQEVQKMLTDAEAKLQELSYLSFMSALLDAQSARSKAVYVKKLVDAADEFKRDKHESELAKAARRKRRHEASVDAAFAGAKVLSVIGGLVGALAGCVNWVGNVRSDFHLFTGAIIGVLAGAITGVLLGFIIGQFRR